MFGLYLLLVGPNAPTTIVFHWYSEMSGVLSYRLRGGEAPHEQKVYRFSWVLVFGLCFLEEQERKDSFSQNNHLKIVIQKVLQLMNQIFSDFLFIVLILFLFVFFEKGFL